jgi:hypothetical protein
MPLNDEEFLRQYETRLRRAAEGLSGQHSYIVRHVRVRYARDRFSVLLPALFRLCKIPGLPVYVARKIVTVWPGSKDKADVVFTGVCNSLERHQVTESINSAMV